MRKMRVWRKSLVKALSQRNSFDFGARYGGLDVSTAPVDNPDEETVDELKSKYLLFLVRRLDHNWKNLSFHTKPVKLDNSRGSQVVCAAMDEFSLVLITRVSPVSESTIHIW